MQICKQASLPIGREHRRAPGAVVLGVDALRGQRARARRRQVRWRGVRERAALVIAEQRRQDCEHGLQIHAGHEPLEGRREPLSARIPIGADPIVAQHVDAGTEREFIGYQDSYDWWASEGRDRYEYDFSLDDEVLAALGR